MSSFRIMPRNSISIADLKNPAMEQLARQYDAGNKGYLSTEEAFRLYAQKNSDAQPANLQQVVEFLGGSQHKVTQRHLDGYELLMSPAFASNWKGDFNIPGLGAGNVRVGRDIRPDYSGNNPAARQDQFMFLIDMNLVEQGRLERDLQGATLVVGPRGFKPEPGSNVPEFVEIPLALATQEGYKSYNRGGGASWVPERKYLAAAVDTDDLRTLAGGPGSLEFYVRLNTNDGRTLYVNKDGKAFSNFDVTAEDLKATGHN